jgi:hypothetical protein
MISKWDCEDLNIITVKNRTDKVQILLTESDERCWIAKKWCLWHHREELKDGKIDTN